MSDITDFLAWVARAEEDYALARLALRRKVPLTCCDFKIKTHWGKTLKMC